MTMRTGWLGKLSCANDAQGAPRNVSHAAMTAPIRQTFMMRSPALIVSAALLEAPGFERRMPIIPGGGKAAGDPGHAGLDCFVACAGRKRPRYQLQDDTLIAATFRAGKVIAATPITIQPRPIHAVDVRVSPRNATPNATPIGIRR